MIFKKPIFWNDINFISLFYFLTIYSKNLDEIEI